MPRLRLRSRKIFFRGQGPACLLAHVVAHVADEPLFALDETGRVALDLVAPLDEQRLVQVPVKVDVGEFALHILVDAGALVDEFLDRGYQGCFGAWNADGVILEVGVLRRQRAVNHVVRFPAFLGNAVVLLNVLAEDRQNRLSQDGNVLE